MKDHKTDKDTHNQIALVNASMPNPMSDKEFCKRIIDIIDIFQAAKHKNISETFDYIEEVVNQYKERKNMKENRT